MVRVLIVDDQEPFRRAAAAVIGMAESFELVGTVGSGEECLAAVPLLRPDLVLLDIGLPGIDGHELGRRLRALPGGHACERRRTARDHRCRSSSSSAASAASPEPASFRS